MLKKMLFVFNPHTAGSKLKNRMLDILCKFAEAGYEISVWPTQAAGHAREIIVTRAAGMDLVVCCGGDGTLNEVVDGLIQLDSVPLLGYIPAGTTNDFASSLLLPKNNIPAAVERILLPKKVFACDVGCFNGRAFTYVAGFGAFTDVSYQTPQNIKNALGYFAYLLEGVQRLPSLAIRRVRLAVDDYECEDEFALGMVTNSASIGGFTFPNSHKVRLDDGLFEVILVRMPHNLAELGELAVAVRKGNYSSPLITVLRGKDIRIAVSEPTAWTLDGEFGGTVAETHIEVLPRAISICI